MRIIAKISMCLVFSTMAAWGQNKTYDYIHYVQQPDSKTGGSVIISQHGNISSQYYNHVYTLKTKSNAILGYRVRLYSDGTPNGQENLNKEKAKFIKLKPDVEVDYEYEAPYHYLYAGKYRTRSEALKLVSEVGYAFEGEYVVEMLIKISELRVE